MIRIGIADDQELVRGGIAMVLRSQPDFEVTWEASNGAEAADLARAEPVDIIVMDVRMPVMDGIAATAAVSALPTAPRVLVLTTFDLDEYAVDALRAGAGGFLLKDAPGEEIVAGVRHVLSGDQVLAPATTGRLLSKYVIARRTPDSDSHLRNLLTERELEVTREICCGASNAEIAGTLYLSEATVKTHVRAILRKIGGRDRVHIVIAAYESGLV